MTEHSFNLTGRERAALSGAKDSYALDRKVLSDSLLRASESLREGSTDAGELRTLGARLFLYSRQLEQPPQPEPAGGMLDPERAEADAAAELLDYPVPPNLGIQASLYRAELLAARSHGGLGPTGKSTYTNDRLSARYGLRGH